MCSAYHKMPFNCILFVLFVIGCVYPTLAQNKDTVSDDRFFEISGQVCDTQGLSVLDCDIALWRSADSTLISACVPNIEGRFVFSNLLPDDYYLQIGGLFYVRKNINVKLQNHNIKLSPIVLEEQVQTETLPEVVVKFKRPRIKQQSGKLLYAVSADPIAKFSSLYQILQRLPLVSISNTGISIKGGLSPTFYINGIPAPHLTQNSQEGLKAIRAEHIKEIQIITNPSVQYDGNISGGIINIVMKQRFTSSWTGSVGGMVNSRDQYSTTSSIAFQLGNLTAQANVTYSNQTKYKEQWELERIMPSSSDHYRSEQEKERKSVQ